jgi:hypothetical protein
MSEEFLQQNSTENVTLNVDPPLQGTPFRRKKKKILKK